MVLFRFSRCAGFLALVLAALSTSVRSQPSVHSGGSEPSAPKSGNSDSGNFVVAQHGHAVGTASFQFTATNQGYDSTSLVKVAMQGLDYALSKTEQLSSANQLEHVQLSAIVNGEAVNVVAEMCIRDRDQPGSRLTR